MKSNHGSTEGTSKYGFVLTQLMLMTHILFVQKRHFDFGCHFLREACALRATKNKHLSSGKNRQESLTRVVCLDLLHGCPIHEPFVGVSLQVTSACFMFLLYGSKHFLGRCLTAEIIPQVFPENDILGHGLYTIDCSACCQP